MARGDEWAFQDATGEMTCARCYTESQPLPILLAGGARPTHRGLILSVQPRRRGRAALLVSFSLPALELLRMGSQGASADIQANGIISN